MNAEKLHAIALAVRRELDQGTIPQKLQQFVTALQERVSQQDAARDAQLATAQHELYRALQNVASDSFSPSWRQALNELGLEDLLGARLQTQIDEVYQKNQLTPSVALREVTRLQQAVTGAQNALDQILASFDHLRIGLDQLEPGHCEFGFVIPRQRIESRFDLLTEELGEMNQIVRTFSEIATGDPSQAQVRTLSTSDFMVYLDAAPKVAALIAECLGIVIAGYLGVLKIRKQKAELVGLASENTLQQLEADANELVDRRIEESSEEIFAKYTVSETDSKRREELQILLGKHMKKIAYKVDRGHNFEVRGEPPGGDGSDSEEARNVETVLKVSSTLQFLTLIGEPILVLPEETVESEPGRPAPRPEDAPRRVKKRKGTEQ